MSEPDGHPAEPLDGTAYSWHSMPSDGRSDADYPLSASCANATCQRWLIRPESDQPWRHREPGEVIDGPANKNF